MAAAAAKKCGGGSSSRPGCVRVAAPPPSASYGWVVQCCSAGLCAQFITLAQGGCCAARVNQQCRVQALHGCFADASAPVVQCMGSVVRCVRCVLHVDCCVLCVVIDVYFACCNWYLQLLFATVRYPVAFVGVATSSMQLCALGCFFFRVPTCQYQFAVWLWHQFLSVIIG